MEFRSEGSNAQRGKIEVFLKSPSGTVSTLLKQRRLDRESLGYERWPFMTLHYWGEAPRGEWQITVVNNNRRGGRRNVKHADVEISQVHLYGSRSVPEAVARIPDQCSRACDPSRGCAAVGAEYCDACAKFRMMSTLECVSSCPEGFTARKQYCYDPNTPEKPCEASMPDDIRESYCYI